MTEEYKCICMSTAHMTKEDKNTLRCMINAHETNMATQRDTGFFVKLYEDLESNQESWIMMSGGFYGAINYAFENGYRMIEFDCDANRIGGLPYHDW